MAEPALYPISIYKGDDYELLFRVKDSLGAYVVLTGWTGRAQIRLSPADVAIIASFTVTVETQTTTPGGVLISMAKTLTSAIAVPAGVYDVEMTDTATKTHTYLKGPVIITDDVTR